MFLFLMISVIIRLIADNKYAMNKKPDPKCEYCNGTGETRHDHADHHGEHVQDTQPCICTVSRLQDLKGKTFTI